MVFGNHIALCHACFKQWMVGDCIPSTCPECEAKGHGKYDMCGSCRQCVIEHNERELLIAKKTGRKPNLKVVPDWP